MDVEVVGDLGFESALELEELPAAVARETLSDDLSGGDVEGGKERGSAVAHVVMGAPLDLPGPHGQQRLSAVERLDLALLVDTEHQRALGRVEVEAYDVAHLLHKQRVRRQLEAL